MYLIEDLYQPTPSSTAGRSSTTSQSTQSSSPGNEISLTGTLSSVGLVILVIFILIGVSYAAYNFLAKRNYLRRREKQWSERVFLEISVPKESGED